MLYSFPNICKFMLKSGGVILFLGISLGVLLLKYQNKLLYIPEVQGLPRSPNNNSYGMQNPLQVGIKYEDVEIKTKDNVKLHGWICKQDKSKNVPTLVFFHENAGNIGTRIYYMKEYYNKVQVNFILVAYRGYSNSEGTPSESGLQLDAEAILQHVFSRKDIDTNRVFLHGRSLGGAVTIYSASSLPFPIKGIIVENTFTSISDMVDVVFNKIRFIKGMVLRNYWPSLTRIPQIKEPIFFIQSMKDQLIPPIQMTQLYKAAESAPFKHLYQIPDGDHNVSWSIDPYTYFQKVSAFIKKAEERQNQE